MVGRLTDRLDALLEDAPALAAPDIGDELEEGEDPRWLGYWLVAMAEETRRVARLSPDVPDGEKAPPPSSLVRQLEKALAQRPAPDPALGQLVIDARSVARRATVVAAYLARRPGPVVAVGDDDGVSLALAMLGIADVHAIDIDPRVLSFLAQSAAAHGACIETHESDVFEDMVPRSLHHRAAIVVTDPFRSAADAAPFVTFGLAMLRRDEVSWFFHCDHPSWSFDHGAIRAMIERAGLSEVGHKRALCRYPITRAGFPRLAETAHAIDVPLSWLEALVEVTSAWSDLFIWERSVP